ncbi:hypothetical protein FUAX_42860 (plasmid) [Fulvitalea axinellae]|uniref:DUF4252 domain-containing protein n=1 Tax=Fulvitalea axinellae TaxID=1182444 RepID=A0AAU9DB80_9BACT|nr:hypothetical protein FUAX_42860 [Fulvitalea axinellae]
MKTLIASLMIFCAGLSSAFAQSALDKFFSEYSRDERFTVVEIKPRLFSLMAEVANDDQDDFDSVITNLTGLKVLAADNVTNGLTMFKKAGAKLEKNRYEELLYVHKPNKTEVRFYIDEDKSGKIKELVLLSASPTNFVMLSITGNLDLDKISKLSGSADIPGMEDLDKVGGKKKKE